MARKRIKTATDAAPVFSYKHKDKRKRIPTQEESVKLTARQKQPVKKRYLYDPSLDPQLVWSGKEEIGRELTVSTVPIYVQEKIAPEALIARLKQGVEKEVQFQLFEQTAQQQFDKAVSFYEHEDNWQNRMILGDSLLVMNSLVEKEGMRGKVQTIYIDPPYGIKFGSNWQVSTRSRDVKDNKVDDFIRQPEQVKAFRDTWELGIHSYLSYLRERLLVARELLNESGSCFVQINDENLHLVRNLLDEVFGSDNFFSLITFKKTLPLGSSGLSGVSDYLLWYCKCKERVKYRELFVDKPLGEGTGYTWVELEDGKRRKMSSEERRNPLLLPKGSKVFFLDKLTSSGYTPTCTYEFDLNGAKIGKQKKSWRTNPNGMKKLIAKGRIMRPGKLPVYVAFHDDYPVQPLHNLWNDTHGATDIVYVVQTSNKVIQRCLLMTSDPGDIVFDPTCGSGTTAFLAEQWGRRWITTDTSRVALALARTRLMCSVFPYYKLRDQDLISAGFEYKSVPHVTLKSLANDEDPDKEILYDRPIEDKKRIRVAGPFTVESLSPHRVSDKQEMLSSEKFIQTVVDNMLSSGIQTGDRGARVDFENLDILPSGPEVQAIGEYKTKDGLKKVAVSIGPEFGSVDDDFVRDASNVAKNFSDLLIVAATSFEAAALAEPSQVNGLQIMKVKINPDLSMGDLLKKTGSGNLFLAFGEPEIKVEKTNEGIIVEVIGVDIYDPIKSEIRSSGSGDPEHEIATWFIDTNYNEEAFFVVQAYFLGGNNPYEKLKKALKADIKEDAWKELYSLKSRPFPRPKTGKIAIKVINHYGDEVMKVVNVA